MAAAQQLLSREPTQAESSSEPGAPLREEPRPGPTQRAITLLFVGFPLLALVVAISQLWGGGVSGLDLAIAGVMYVLVALGITVGYHRMLTHHGFRPARPLKIALVVLGSLAYQGGPIGWVADHRRHHRFSDRPGDPHTPSSDDRTRPGWRGLAHAHVGWLFDHTLTPTERYAPDLLKDRDIVMIDRLFPLWCGVSLAIPFAAGYLLGGGLAAAATAMLWAGGVRILLLQHVTWSINSICHAFGSRPMRTRDDSGNVAWLAPLALGESWHNVHHAMPRSARHGVLPHQWDPSAQVIRTLERLGWATEVVWPTPKQIQAALIQTPSPDPSAVA